MTDPDTTSAFQPSTLGYIITFAGLIAAVALPPIRRVLWKISDFIVEKGIPTAAGIGWLRPIFAFVVFVLLLGAYAFMILTNV